ncbi:hypothetical protein FB451DRAFT_1211195 [Mycena latifolia]|nr:hypothetical protein FB451DRAFT_1211195 [Mycena latifolia]
MANARCRSPTPPRPTLDNILPQTPRDAETLEGRNHRRTRNAGRGPWKHMTDTYAWVESHCSNLDSDSRRRKTEKWVHEQQIFYSANPRDHLKGWDDMILIYDNGAQRWMREEEESRQREKEKARIIEEELKRIENRIRRRREMETAAARSRAAELKARERSKRAKAEQAIQDAWRRYEKGWVDLANSNSEQTAFTTVPWPLAWTPKTVEQITPVEMEFFLLSPLHSEDQTAKERIRRAQLRWHPDRFRRILGKVKSTDRAAVEEGAGAVARCLNDMMARETDKSRRHQ